MTSKTNVSKKSKPAYYKTIKELTHPLWKNLLNNTKATIHAIDRQDRLEKWFDVGGGIGEALATFQVDKKHANGNEVHLITSTGLIFVYNLKTRRLVTWLIGRHEQLTRNYKELDMNIPQDILNASKNVQNYLDKGIEVNYF